MKFLISSLLLLSFSAFATETVIEPSIIDCDKDVLASYVKVKGRSAVTIASKIKLEPREAFSGDPAIWSLLHMTKIEFPVSKKAKKACFLLEKAYLNSAKSVGYDASLGRLIELSVSVATGDEEGSIGSKDVKVNIRVNQAAGTVTIE
jgi:hypothetical protein